VPGWSLSDWVRSVTVEKPKGRGYIANPHGCVRLRAAFQIDWYVKTIFKLFIP